MALGQGRQGGQRAGCFMDTRDSRPLFSMMDTVGVLGRGGVMSNGEGMDRGW